jgi:hypothetical protein
MVRLLKSSMNYRSHTFWNCIGHILTQLMCLTKLVLVLTRFVILLVLKCGGREHFLVLLACARLMHTLRTHRLLKTYHVWSSERG